MSLTLTLPTLETRPANPPETRVAHVAKWLADAVRRDPVNAAQVVGDKAPWLAVVAATLVAVNNAARSWQAVAGGTDGP